MAMASAVSTSGAPPLSSSISPRFKKPFSFSSSSSPPHKSLLPFLRRCTSQEAQKDLSCLADVGKKKNWESVTYNHLLGDEVTEFMSSVNANYTSGYFQKKGGPVPYIYNGIKMALLVGLLTFQGSQQAIANTGSMQPLSYFEDLGDINTGISADLFF